MSERPIRVLVVDDSAFARKVVREVLSGDSRIEVVGFARDGLDALEKIAETKPDVITMDLVMPGLDGIGVLDALRESSDPPRVVVVTMSDADSVLGVAALQGGAFDVVHKPTALATDLLYQLGDELVAKVVLAARSPAPPAGGRAQAPLARAVPRAARTKIIVIGASTGGPRAVTQLLGALPGSLPVPVAIVVHMPQGYTEAFARRLDGASALTVVEASDAMVLVPGCVAIAPSGIHLRIRCPSGECVTSLDPLPVESLHRPSVDVLLASAAAAFGDGVLAAVLTGMGSDGLEGAEAVRAAGGRVLVESASSCVVYGMPRAIADAGLADATFPLDQMAAALVERL